MMQKFAKELRQNLTTTEEVFWKLLRNRRLGGYKFRRQVSIGPYIVDYVCFEKRLIIELDGGQHNTKQHKYDETRSQWLHRQGFQILRFWNDDALKHQRVIQEEILKVLRARENLICF